MTSTPVQDAWLLKVLGLAAGGGRQQSPARTFSLVALQKSRLAWDSLRKNLQVQLRTIEQSLLKAVQEHNADEAAEDEYDPDEIASGVRDIYTILDKLDTRLIDKLDEALNAEGDKRASLNAEAGGIIKEYQAVVESDPLLGRIDVNGFASTTIRATAQKTLAALAQQL